MRDLDDFLLEINPKAPGCPAPAAYQAILQACDDLCVRTKTWRYSDDIIISGTDEIDFFPPSGAVLIDFESVLFGDTPLEAKTIKWMDQCMRGWRRGTIEGVPRFYTQLDMNTLRIAPIDNGTLTVNCWLKPAMDADQVPDFLFEQWHEVIAWGALGRILSTPNQPFTDVQMGAAYLAAFMQKLDGIAFKGTTGQQRAPLRTRSQFM